MVYLRKLKATYEGFATVVRNKSASPTWSDVKLALLDFDRAGLRGLVQDLYTASKDNQAFLHARLGLGHDQLQPFKASISRWISPDLMKGQPVSASKAKKAIADYKKAIGRIEGMVELSIFYCEEAIGFLESCSMESESYVAALVRMYGRSVELVSRLSAYWLPFFLNSGRGTSWSAGVMPALARSSHEVTYGCQQLVQRNSRRKDRTADRTSCPVTAFLHLEFRMKDRR